MVKLVTGANMVCFFLPKIIINKAPVLTGLLLLCASTLSFGNECQSLRQLSPLLGFWQHHQNEQMVNESWQQVSENTYEGAGVFFVKGTFDKVQSTESLRLVKMLDGIFYLAKPKSNALPVAFKLMTCEKKRFVFINEQHDFPQKIVYQVKSRDEILVDVRTMSGQGFSLNFKRNVNINNR